MEIGWRCTEKMMSATKQLLSEYEQYTRPSTPTFPSDRDKTLSSKTKTPSAMRGQTLQVAQQ